MTDSRIIGLDIARGSAIVGMFAAHVAPTQGEQLWDGRSSVLFATLAGVSLGLMTGGAQPGRQRLRNTVSVLLRGVFLVLLGVLLIALGTPIAVILPHYGLMFIVAAAFLYAPRWLLALLVLAFAVLGPIAVDAITEQGNLLLTGVDAWTSFIAAEPFTWLTRYYPMPSWLAYVAVGLLLARCDVRSASTQAAMILGGGAAALAGYTAGRAIGGDVFVEAHSSTTAELFGAGGVAVAVIGALCWLSESAPRGFRAPALRILTPLSASGSMPLTIYSVQLVVLALYLTGYPNIYDFDAWRSWTLLAALVLGSFAFALLWSRVSRQGPLEWLFARITLRPRR
ncbi:DUF418 domain-containing protein [Microbacteriaceae bacterium VKM Ac-2854]|nr:DUF418 domain-containing protein [Microbacteriaceae bacterium VKM Ac-2854]